MVVEILIQKMNANSTGSMVAMELIWEHQNQDAK